MRINVGDKVRNLRDGKLGIVIRVFNSGSIAVLENVSPTVTNTHDSFKTLEVVEKHSVDIFDETSKDDHICIGDPPY